MFGFRRTYENTQNSSHALSYFCRAKMFPISRDETILLSHYLYIKPRPDFGDKFSAFLGIIDNIFGASFFIVFISVHAAR